MKNILSIDDLTNDEISAVLDNAARIKREGVRGTELAGRIAALLFFEPSTRTRLSFASAAQRLGMGVIGFDDPATSSAAKGESLTDTIQVVQSYADLIVLRHPRAGAAHEAAGVAAVPLVNGGDGGREHPTQTLYDLFTVRERFGRLDGLRVGFYGDLRFGRAANSLALALARFGAEPTWIAPADLQPAEEVVAAVRGRGAVTATAERLTEVLSGLDVLYISRPQRERWPAALAAEPAPVTRELLGRAPEQLLVLHPLPRTDELAVDVDADPRAGYFRQAANGVPVRMAVLRHLLAG
ncbi:aspartate carbamoyltransferase [Kitasatospora sp. NPDC052868]|uniref:aspartate carbamoyltransferase n=1 Tax=Kitasatospora sp. NPDC052868 TaxID=3364060 RepID=UPI0037C62A45